MMWKGKRKNNTDTWKHEKFRMNVNYMNLQRLKKFTLQASSTLKTTDAKNVRVLNNVYISLCNLDDTNYGNYIPR